MKNIVLVLLFVAVSLSANAFAVTPTAVLTPKEKLVSTSNAIVDGQIVDVACTGKTEKTSCINYIEYKAKLKVEKVTKGNPVSEVDIYFNAEEVSKNCDVDYNEPDTIHYKGDSGRYYLTCNGAKCHLVSQDGVEYKTKGEKKLPKCAKTN